MDKIVFITPTFAVTSALAPTDFAEVRRLGFCSVISNRPGEEDAGQAAGHIEAAHAWRAGLGFQHVPAGRPGVITDAAVEGMADALERLDGPVLAHCSTGLRSAILWAAASARSHPVDCVLTTLHRAGFELDFLREDLLLQAGRKRRLGVAPALDCSGMEVFLPGAHPAIAERRATRQAST